jgi:1-acyl-sn-glycerol-3-phosphate acyltransferase
MVQAERFGDVSLRVQTLFTVGRHLVADARFIANGLILRGLLATSGIAVVLLHRFLPERHSVLPDHQTLWALTKLQARALTVICGVAVDVRGTERLRVGGPFIFTPNHQGQFDLVALFGFLPGRNRFVATEKLIMSRIFGPLLEALGMIAIDGQPTNTAIEQLDAVTAEDESIVFFPEGRPSPQARLLPFADVPFIAAIRLGRPVVPVAIRGARRLMADEDSFGIRPGRVEIIVEEPIPTEGLIPDDCRPLREDVRAVIARHVEELEALIEEGPPDGGELLEEAPGSRARGGRRRSTRRASR